MIRLLVLCSVMVPSMLAMVMDQAVQVASLEEQARRIFVQTMQTQNYAEYVSFIESLEPQVRKKIINRSVDEMGVTSLHHAASCGELELLEILLSHGANIHARTSISGYTPLHAAAYYNEVAAIRCLAHHHADLEAAATGTYNEFLTPLHIAASRGNVEAIEALLEQGAYRNARALYLVSPLHLAAGHNHLEAIFCLYKHGANLQARSRGHTPCDYARYYDSARACLFLEMLEELMRIAKDLSPDAPNNLTQQLEEHRDAFFVNLFAKPMCTLLMKAACEGFWQIVEQLLADRRTKIHLCGYKGNTALHLAVEKGHEKTVSLLLSATPQQKALFINNRNDDGDTALHVAHKNKHTQVVDALIRDTSLDLGVANRAGITGHQIMQTRLDAVTPGYDEQQTASVN